MREYHDGRTDEHLEADIERAIDYCIERGILKDFLEKRRGEVVESMAMDFTFERQLELEVADARDDARAEGLAEGREEGLQQGMQQGRMNAIQNMLRYGVPKEKILMDYTETEVAQAEQDMIANV